MANPLLLAFVGTVIGLCVGLTGIGGGALMTPTLLLLGVDPLTAVASDLVVSLVMKPIGASVHLRKGTVNFDITRWLMIGSVPTAFAGAAVVDRVGAAHDLAPLMKKGIGLALLLAVVAMFVRGRLKVASNASTASPGARPLATVALGAIGGVLVGLTSVGSGSLMIVGLMLLYPSLEQRSLVGTDLAQAIPLVGAAALGHALFGSVSMTLALPLIAGAVPAVYLGARLSSKTNVTWIRHVLVVLLGASSLQLLGVPSLAVAAVLLGVGVVNVSRPIVRMRVRPSA
jgi:uncharacterized protein